MHTLLPERKINLPPHPFATDWQAVIFRNYGTVKTENLANVLKTDVETIEREAARLGLSGLYYEPKWKEKGYITIIKNNWHLLDYNGVCTLAEMTEEELGKTLLEDDFLFVKVGNFKPVVTPPVYSPLTEGQIKYTAAQAETVKKNRPKTGFSYFDFFKYVPKTDEQRKSEKQGLKMVYNYNELFGDNLYTGDFSAYSDEMLKSLSALGVNALWKHVVLYDLVGLPFDARYGAGWEKRLENLAALCEKLDGYGIKLYLYLNEPRALPIGFFKNRKDLLGVYDSEVGALCTSSKEVQTYLYEAVKKVATAAPKLGGFFSITSSENLTNCYSRSDMYDICKCPRCKDRTRSDVCVELNEIYRKAIKDANSDAKLIAWTWGWTKAFGWEMDEVFSAIDKISPDTDIMCVSEEDLKIPTDEGGEMTLVDYSISQVGPSARTKDIFNRAKKAGHNVVAKMQVNNSWECASVPYIPCFELIWKHLKGLRALDVDGHMLSWSLGGYPSFNLSLVSHEQAGGDIDEWYETTFGAEWRAVKTASEAFSSAFEKLPFGVSLLYNGPQNVGCANPIYEESTGLTSSMVGFPFDDIDVWRGGFKKQTFLARLKALTDGWRDGLKALDSVTGYNAACVKRIATATYCQFYSTYLQSKWIIEKDASALKAEFGNVKTFITLAAEDATLGYEASNHYLFTQNTLLEKLLGLEKILNKYGE